jgi:hypothetical protein
VEPDEDVSLKGQNFHDDDVVHFDDAILPNAIYASASQMWFTVPHQASGGPHYVRVGSADPNGRMSNKVVVTVRPKLLNLSPERWTEGLPVTLDGLAFQAGCQVLAVDKSQSGEPTYLLPTTFSSPTLLEVQIPPAPLGALRGVRRIYVRNPDLQRTTGEHVARIGEQRVLKVAAYRVRGYYPTIAPSRSLNDITMFFTNGAPVDIGGPWAQAKIVFTLVQPVTEIEVDDDLAFLFPRGDQNAQKQLFASVQADPGVLNYFFVRDVDTATAFAYLGGGPCFIGDNGDFPPSDEHLRRIIAHETGHALCLVHVCPNEEEKVADTLFQHDCTDDDLAFLMYPYWNTQTDVALTAGEIASAQTAASYFEQGKTTAVDPAWLFGNASTPLCQSADVDN